MLPTVHTLARFEQAKEQFKQQMCHNVDTLFNIFVSELNSNRQLTTSSNSIVTNDDIDSQLIPDTVELNDSSNNAVAQQHLQQQQCLNANAFHPDQSAHVQMRSSDNQQQKVPQVSNNEHAHEANFNLEAQQKDQNANQTNDLLMQNHSPQQQQSHNCQPTLFSIKQEITDEDDTNWEESAHDDNISHDYVPGCQCDSCQSGATNHEEAYNDCPNVQNHLAHNSFDNVVAPYNSAPCSYSMNDDEEIYDEELLREVKEEILEEQRINAMKQKNDQIGASQVGISTYQMTDDVDQIINSNSISTSTQPIFPSPALSTSSVSSNSSVQSNYEEGEITNCQTEQNTESNALEDGELIDSDEDENFTECANISSSSLSNHNFLLFDQFRVISENCPTCDLPFGTNEGMNVHMFQAHKMLPFQCPFPVCSKSKISFLTINELTEHFQCNNHNHSQKKCSQCDKKCDSPIGLFTHTIDNHRQGLFACAKDNCKYVARFRGTATKHYNRKHLNNRNQTSEELLTRDNMSKERLSVINQPEIRSLKRKCPSVDQKDNTHSKSNSPFRVISVKCTDKGCHSEFSTETELSNHLKIKHRIFHHVCPIEICDISFKLRSDLIRHSLVHRDMHKFYCSKCEYHFRDFMLLCKHNFTNHQEGKFLCGYETCDYVGIFRNDTIKHYICNHLHKTNE